MRETVLPALYVILRTKASEGDFRSDDVTTHIFTE